MVIPQTDSVWLHWARWRGTSPLIRIGISLMRSCCQMRPRKHCDAHTKRVNPPSLPPSLSPSLSLYLSPSLPPSLPTSLPTNTTHLHSCTIIILIVCSSIYTKFCLMCQNGQASMRNTPQIPDSHNQHILRWDGTTKVEPYCDEYIKPVHNTPLFFRCTPTLPPSLPSPYPKHKHTYTSTYIHTNTHSHTQTVVHTFNTYLHQPVEEDGAHAGKDSWVEGA